MEGHPKAKQLCCGMPISRIQTNTQAYSRIGSTQTSHFKGQTVVTFVGSKY